MTTPPELGHRARFVPGQDRERPYDDEGGGGAGLELWAHLGVKLEALTEEIRRERKMREYLWKTVHRVQVTGPAIPPVAGGLVDAPDILGARRGWWWDIRRIMFSDAGAAQVVWVWKNFPVATNLVDIFEPTAAGNLRPRFYGKGQILIGGDERLVYGWQPGAQPGPPGVAISAEAIQIAEDCLPVYLT